MGALRLISTARMPNSRIWMVAPEAYQKGPDMPYCHATLELQIGEGGGKRGVSSSVGEWVSSKSRVRNAAGRTGGPGQG